MIAPQPRIEGPPLVLHVPRWSSLTADEFFEFCQRNRDLRIERSAKGDVLIMSPTGGAPLLSGFELNLGAIRDPEA